MSKSNVEEALLWQLQCSGLPLPQREYRFHPKRKWPADFAWPKHKILVEVEGGIYIQGRHTRPGGYIKDCEKYNAATMMGYKVLRFTPDMIHDGSALAMIEEALAMTNANIQIVPLNQKYLCFTSDTDIDLAKRTFTSRFGMEPKEVIEEARMIRVGPAPEDA